MSPFNTNNLNTSLYYWLGCGVLLLATALRLYHLAWQPIWMDESYSGLLIQQDDFIGLLSQENNPPLYFLMQKIWGLLTGTSPFYLRLISATAGVLTVGLWLFYGQRTLGRGPALLAGVLATLSVNSIYYSQEARPYSLLLCLITFTILSLLEYLQTSRTKILIPLTITLILISYTHFFGLLAILPIVLYALSNSRDEAYNKRHLLTCLCVTVISWVPLFGLIMLNNKFGSDFHHWIEKTWRELNYIMVIPRSFESFLFGSGSHISSFYMKQLTAEPLPNWLTITSTSMTFILTGLALVTGIFLRQTNQRRVLALGVIGSLSPLLILLSISFWKPYYLPGRYDIIALPYFILLISILATHKAPKVLRICNTIAIALSCLFMGYKIYLYHSASPHYSRINESPAIAYLQHHLQHKDAVIFAGGRGPEALYLLSQKGFQWHNGQCRHISNNINTHCLLFPYITGLLPFDFNNPGRKQFDVKDYLNDIRGIATGNNAPTRIWVAWERPLQKTKPSTGKVLIRSLSFHDYKPAQQQPESELGLELYLREIKRETRNF